MEQYYLRILFKPNKPQVLISKDTINRRGGGEIFEENLVFRGVVTAFHSQHSTRGVNVRSAATRMEPGYQTDI